MNPNVDLIRSIEGATRQESLIIFPTKFVLESPEGDGLDSLRGLAWCWAIEAGTCLAVVIGWSCWVLIH